MRIERVPNPGAGVGLLMERMPWKNMNVTTPTRSLKPNSA